MNRKHILSFCNGTTKLLKAMALWGTWALCQGNTVKLHLDLQWLTFSQCQYLCNILSIFHVWGDKQSELG